MSDVVLVDSEEGWQGLYINGKLVMQNHSLRVRDVLHELGRRKRLVSSFELREADTDWLERRGSLPSNLDEVELA